MTARETLAAFVAGGNMREADAPSMSPDRTKELRERVTTLQSGTATLNADDAPSDFRAAIQQREQEAATKAAKSRGADVPRRWENHPILKHVYGVHDAIASLPAPGGLAALLIAIVVLFFLLIPATSAGETRGLLLWEVILGQKRIPTSDEQTGSGSMTPLPAQQQQTNQQATQQPATQTGSGSMYALPAYNDYPMSGAPDGL